MREQQLGKTRDRHERVVEIMGDTAGHLPEGAQPLLLDDLVLGGLQVGEGLFQLGVEFAQGIGRLLAFRDVLQGALEMENGPSGIPHDPRILRNPNDAPILASHLALEIRDRAFGGGAMKKFRPPLRLEIKFSRSVGQFRNQLTRRIVAENARHRGVRAQATPVRREQKNTLDGILENAAVLLLGHVPGRLGLLPAREIVRGDLGQLLDGTESRTENEWLAPKPITRTRAASPDDPPAQAFLVGQRTCEGIKGNLIGRREPRIRIEDFVEKQVGIAVDLHAKVVPFLHRNFDDFRDAGRQCLTLGRGSQRGHVKLAAEPDAGLELGIRFDGGIDGGKTQHE